MNRSIKNFFDTKFSLKKINRFFIKVLIFLLVFFLLVPFNLFFVLKNHYKAEIFKDVEKIEEARVAIVFGAGLTDESRKPSEILKDRILAAIDLYKAGKVKKIIMSGDNRFDDYNEPQIMVNYAKQNGVNSFDLQADYAGRRTYDTCYRAKYIFGVEKAILVTQEFHLTRALYICNTLGVDSVGFAADKQAYQGMANLQIREFFATVLSYWELNIIPPAVVLGDKINF